MTAQLEKITALIGSKQYSRALSKLSQYVAKNKKDYEAHRLLGVLYLQKQNTSLAEKHLFKSLQLNPNHQPTQINLASLYKAQKNYPKAHACIAQVIEKSPDNISAHYNLGNLYRDEGNFSCAKTAFQQTLKLNPNHLGALVTMGFISKNTGDIDSCLDYFHQALAIDPYQPKIYWALANLKKYRFTKSEQAIIDQMLSKAADNATPELLFTKAYILEHQELYDQAFEQLQRANNKKYKELKRKPFNWQQFSTDIEQVFTPEFIAKNSSKIKRHPQPIFIVGMPRSGSTLTEQILASHSAIHGAAELPHLPKLVAELGAVKKAAYPFSFKDVGHETMTNLGERYIVAVSSHLNETLFTDKQPLNFNFIGVILMALPNAKIIHCTRQDQAVLLSCYKQLFAHGHEYTYNIEELVHNYQHQQRIMAYWKSCFPEQIFTVKYENMVDQTEQQIKDLLAFLDLEFQQSCLHFHQTKRNIKTASAGQVTQKIYDSSVFKHTHYKNSMTQFSNLLNNG